LPKLQVNLSDTKYKSLMRLIDVCIPHFDEGPQESAPAPPPGARDNSGVFPPLPLLFGSRAPEYNVDDHDADGDVGTSEKDLFFDAEDGGTEVSETTLP
jgi:vacuolar protein sorting-associated protein 13A/C